MELKEIPDKRIQEFIKEHHVAALSAVEDGEIWSWHVFYAYLEEENKFVVTSDPETRHTGMLKRSRAAYVSGAIALETETIGLIRGLQFTAEAQLCSESFINRYRLRYLKRFPYAVVKMGELWVLTPDVMKFTDNRLGFGKKLNWRAKKPL
jgi:uncharacterized protein YhbP (UPF0306 family)